MVFHGESSPVGGRDFVSPVIMHEMMENINTPGKFYIKPPKRARALQECQERGKEDVGTQTNIKVDVQKKKGQHNIIRVIRRYQENGENVEKFEENTSFDSVEEKQLFVCSETCCLFSAYRRKLC